MNCIKTYKLYLPFFGGISSLLFKSRLKNQDMICDEFYLPNNYRRYENSQIFESDNIESGVVFNGRKRLDFNKNKFRMNDGLMIDKMKELEELKHAFEKEELH